MNGRLVKKIKKYSKRNWIEYVRAVEQWPYSARLRFAWHMINPIKEVKAIIKRR